MILLSSTRQPTGAQILTWGASPPPAETTRGERFARLAKGGGAVSACCPAAISQSNLWKVLVEVCSVPVTHLGAHAQAAKVGQVLPRHWISSLLSCNANIVWASVCSLKDAQISSSTYLRQLLGPILAICNAYALGTSKWLDDIWCLIRRTSGYVQSTCSSLGTWRCLPLVPAWIHGAYTLSPYQLSRLISRTTIPKHNTFHRPGPQIQTRVLTSPKRQIIVRRQDSVAGHVNGGFPPDWTRRAMLKRDVNWEKAPWLGTHPNLTGIDLEKAIARSFFRHPRFSMPSRMTSSVSRKGFPCTPGPSSRVPYGHVWRRCLGKLGGR